MHALDTESGLDLDRRDQIALAPGLTLTDDGILVDRWLKTESPANATAAVVLDQLETGPIELVDLTDAHAKRFGLPTEQAESDLRRLLAALDDRAALAVRRSPRSYLAPLAVRDEVVALLTLRPRRKIARRHPLTMRGIAVAVWRQSRIALAAMTMVGVALAALIHAQLPPDASLSTSVEAGAVIVLLGIVHAVLLFFHELGHAALVAAEPSAPALVAVRGFRIGVVYSPMPTHRPRLIAAAGPLLAAVVATLIGLLGFQLSTIPWSALRLAPLLGLAHLASLLPWAADGRTLWRAERTPPEPGR